MEIKHADKNDRRNEQKGFYENTSRPVNYRSGR